MTLLVLLGACHGALDRADAGQDAGSLVPDARIIVPDATYTGPDGSLVVPDAMVVVPDASVPDAKVDATIDPPTVVVGDAPAVVEGQTLTFPVTVSSSQRTRLELKTTQVFAANNLTPDQKSMRTDLFAPGEYIANGTVLTRSVANMPLASNSADIAAYARTMPAQYLTDQFKDWLVTSINTVHYNIAIYVVDSSDPNQPEGTFQSMDPRVTTKADLVQYTTGQVPMPTYAYPDTIGDRAMAIYDRGTGMMREYFYAVEQVDGSWTFSASGIFQAKPDLNELSSDNFFMRLTTGSSSVVGMLTPLSQIGISEALSGEINHALSVTFPNAAAGVTSFPARQSDGTDNNPNAPAQGQWFRIDPSVDIDAMALRPFTKVVAKAIQKYGGYGADKNLWCFAFNVEHPANLLAAGQPDPWASGGAIRNKYGSLDLNDFPWHMTQWAPVDWNDKLTDAAKSLPRDIVVQNGAAKTSLGADGGVIELAAGTTNLTVLVPTSTLNGFELLGSVTLEAKVGTASDNGSGAVNDAP